VSEPFEADIKKYTEALAADPKSRVFVPLADIYRKLGRYDEAIAIAKEGLLHHPNYMGGKVALARAYFENGDLDPAEEYLREILNFASDNLVANRLLAQIYLQKGENDKAIPLLKQLQAFEPGDSWVAQQLNQAANLSKPSPPKPPVAKPSPAKPAETTPQTVTLAELYRSQGHLEQARSIYQLLARADPTNAKVSNAVAELERELSARQTVATGGVSKRKEVLEKLLSTITTRRRRAA
jgi:tetratricopeptide (TPR) repeat protein